MLTIESVVIVKRFSILFPFSFIGTHIRSMLLLGTARHRRSIGLDSNRRRRSNKMRRKAIIIVGCQHRLSSSVVRCAETFLSVCLCDITFYCWCSAGGHFSLYIFFCHSAPARYSLDGRADTAAIPRQYDKRNISGCLDESEFLFLVWL